MEAGVTWPGKKGTEVAYAFASATMFAHLRKASPLRLFGVRYAAEFTGVARVRATSA